MTAARTTAHPIDPEFVHRWSPRAFGPEAIDEATLYTLFEAARWAPSGSNSQPWRFVYALRDSAEWPQFLGLLNERNQLWAGRAAALVLVISKTTRVREGETQPSRLRSHSFDTGAAWLSLALQGLRLGWRTRAIGGYERERAREALAVPPGYEPEVFIAIGRQADSNALPADLKKREQPNGRLPLSALVARGSFHPDLNA
jgi:nitroreductase